MQTLGAEQIKALSPYLGGEGSAAHTALHAVLECAGGAASGGDCGAGALGASAGVVLNTALDQLSRTEGLSASEKEARADLVASLVAGVAQAVGAETAQAVTAARVETLFNRQLHPDERASIDRRKGNYAKRYGLTVAQAEQELLTQANLMLQNGSPGQWNERAAAFLREHKGLLPADGNSGTGYMFYATPEQRANTAMYAGYYPNGEGLNLPPSGDVAHSVERQNAYQDSYEKMTWGAAAGAATIAVGGPIMALPGAPILSSSGALGSGALASPVGTGAISATINAGAQYMQNGSINPVDVGGAFMTGAAGSIYTGLAKNVGINILGGATTTALNNLLHGKSDSIFFGGFAAGATSALGYGIGKGMSTAIEKAARPTINSSSWAAPGQWAGPTGWNIFAPNNLPAIGSSAGGAFGTELGSSVVNKLKEPSK